MTDIPDSDHLKHPPSKDVQGKKEMELFMKEIKKQHQDMLNAIKRKNQEISDLEYMSQFSAKVDASTELFKESRFCSLILSQLKFEEMPNRQEAIPEAHQKTFDWLFKNPSTPQTPPAVQDPPTTQNPATTQTSATTESPPTIQVPATT